LKKKLISNHWLQDFTLFWLQKQVARKQYFMAVKCKIYEMGSWKKVWECIKLFRDYLYHLLAEKVYKVFMQLHSFWIFLVLNKGKKGTLLFCTKKFTRELLCTWLLLTLLILLSCYTFSKKCSKKRVILQKKYFLNLVHKFSLLICHYLSSFILITFQPVGLIVFMPT